MTAAALGSNWSGCASTHRERSSACPVGRPRRAASARRWAPTSPNTAGSDRSTGSVACARRSFSSSRLAGAVMRVQSSPASASARACPSMSAWIAASVRWRGLSVIPWRRRTACACSSAVCHASRLLGSTGSLLASLTSARQLRCSNARAQRGKQRCSWRAASVLRACTISRSRSRSGPPSQPGRLNARPELVEAAAGATSAAWEVSVIGAPFVDAHERPRTAGVRVVGWSVRAGRARRFSGRAGARSGGCARRRSARRGHASARARAGSDRGGRRPGRRRPRRSRCGCPQRAARIGQQQAGARRASARLGSLGVIE